MGGLFKGTPAYFGECQVAPRNRDRGFFGWVSRMLGFPETPNYAPPDPVTPEPDPETCPPGSIA